MAKKIIYKKQYIGHSEVDEIRKYFDEINDSPYDSRGPHDTKKNALGWQGCWDRQLHLEKIDNPIHTLISKLKNDFGDFVIYESSIRYFCAPFLPHSDIRDSAWLKQARQQNLSCGFVFLIPLWWQEHYQPGTAFYSSPAKLEEPLYVDMLEILPKFSEDSETRNFSIRQICHWQSPGDLIAWENFQFHGSCGHGIFSYDRKKWIKEFISIETWKYGSRYK